METLRSGGAETMVRNLTRELAAAGVDVRIVSIYDDGLSAGERKALGVPVATAARGGRGDLGFFSRLVGLLRAQRPDVVHAHVHAGKFAGRAAALLAGVPSIVFTEHGEDLGGPLRAAANAVLHARTSRFITFSQAQRLQFSARERVPPEKVVVIPNGVRRPPAADRRALRAELGLPENAFVAFLPARMVPLKNHAAIIDALAELREGDQTWYVVFAGEGPLEPSLRARALAKGVGEAVRFLGFRNDAGALCAAMDVLVMASDIERMPVALGEAMRAGLPVVVAPWPGVEDFVRDGLTGVVAAAGTPHELARALVRVRGDDALRAAVVRGAHVFADEHFALERTVREHVDLYRALRDEHARTASGPARARLLR